MIILLYIVECTLASNNEPLLYFPRFCGVDLATDFVAADQPTIILNKMVPCLSIALRRCLKSRLLWIASVATDWKDTESVNKEI